MGRTTKSDFKHHYDTYQGKPEQIEKRAQRNKAHAIMEKKVGKAALKGKDVDHKKPIRSGGGNGNGNLRVRARSPNRGDTK